MRTLAKATGLLLAAVVAESVYAVVVPEYAPVQLVVVHEDLVDPGYHFADLAQAVVAAGADMAVIGKRSKISQKLGNLAAALRRRVHVINIQTPNFWIRDYGPLFYVEQSWWGGPKLGAADLVYGLKDRPGENFPKKLAKSLGITPKDLPLAMDGGNFLVAGTKCFTSSGLVERGAGGGEFGVQLGLLKDLGCTVVVNIEDPPHRHLDMWAKVVDDRTILVSEVEDATMALARQRGINYRGLLELRDRLNEKAGELSRHLRVERLPLPLPYRGVFRTYANSLLINGHAVVPRFERWGWKADDYPDAVLAAAHENTVRAVYERHGYHTVFINADALAYNGGALHCVALQVPTANPRNLIKF